MSEIVRKLSLLPDTVADPERRVSSFMQASYPPLSTVDDAPVKVLPGSAAPSSTGSGTSDLDAFLKRLGNPGRYQIVLYIVLCMSYFVIAPNNLAMIFLAAEPSQYLCTEKSFIFNNVSERINRTGQGGGVKRYNDTFRMTIAPGLSQQCTVLRSAVSKREGQEEQLTCSRWRFPEADRGNEARTIITDFGLVCKERWKSSLANTMYFIGTMVGAVIFGYMGDRFGRRLVVLGTAFLSIIFGAAAAYAPSYVAFVILRFILGAVVQGIQVFYAVMMEWFPTYQRAVLGTLSECFWGVGVIILALWGYVFYTWHAVQLAIALTGLVLLVAYYFVIEESIRWLLVSNRTKQARIVAAKVLRINRLGSELSPEMEKELTRIGDNLRCKDDKVVHYTFVDCFRTAKIRRVTLFLMYIWFSLALGYYGLSFSVDTLVGNAALNLFIGGLLEMIPYAACSYAVPRYGRKLPLVILNTASGIMCIISGVLPTTPGGGYARTVLALLGRMAVSGSFCSVIVWTTELFPTVIRSNGLGMAMLGLRLGSVLSPQIVLLGYYTFTQLPVIIFGVGVLIGAILAWFLEETLHKESLPDTIHDAEKSQRASVTPSGSTVTNKSGQEPPPTTVVEQPGNCMCGH